MDTRTSLTCPNCGAARVAIEAARDAVRGRPLLPSPPTASGGAAPALRADEVAACKRCGARL